jgi:hypothetical protein
MAAAATPAQVFADELRRHRPEPARPLPIHYRPLATAIVGDRPVRLSTSQASRRALAKVGKAAATTADTIHVGTSRPTAEVIAHELTHVAHPSPVPRFFGDDDRSPEERKAEQVAAIMRRAPVLQRTTTAHSTVSAAALAASIQPGATVQREITTANSGSSTVAAPPPPTPASPPQQSPPAESDSPPHDAATTDAMFDRILELLEDRILTELERRGGRFRGGF